MTICVKTCELLQKVDGFTKKYGIHHLVYFEQYNDIESAINRETNKEMKHYGN
jgi:predicted GIY-YIG superfamily endonuclease